MSGSTREILESQSQLSALAGEAVSDALILRRPEACAIVIFGAMGDLAHKKLFPALFSLFVRDLLSEKVALVGVDLRDLDLPAFRKAVKQALVEHSRDQVTDERWKEFAEKLRFVRAGGSTKTLFDELEKCDSEVGTEGNRVYYLAVPPSVMESLVTEIGKHRSKMRSGFTRLIVEKPFGHDRESARRLNKIVLRYFDESELFRIDHYLGKTTVETLSVLRFSNAVFEPIWNREKIDHVQITVAEDIGIEGRAGFYEEAGALKDVFQNHLLQLVTLTAMEAPFDLKADSVRNEKVKVLRAMYTPSPKNVVRGQYGAGFIHSDLVRGYREEVGVSPNSMIETYVAAKLYIDNGRWAGVPFYVRTGKRLPRRETVISIYFKSNPHTLFRGIAARKEPNVLTIHVQPNEGFDLTTNVMAPGQRMSIRPVNMGFRYDSMHADMPEAYERLVLDCMLGDATLFTRADEVEEQWAIVDSICSDWHRDQTVFPNYAAGTWGPSEADEMIGREGRSWRQ